MVVFAPTPKRLVLKQLLFFCAVAFAILISGANAEAQVLFEGYSKVLLGSKQVGFVIQRFEFDQKKKEFLATSFVKTNELGGNITESTQSRATATLKPLSYKYTSAAGDKVKLIDGTFKGDTMTIAVVENGKRKVLPAKKLPVGVFLANYLPYVMLQGKEGIKVGANYAYQAIAEEDGNVYTGQAYVKGEEVHNGIPVYRVLSTFMVGTPSKVEFVFFMTSKGEIVGSKQPMQGVSTALVANIQEATAGMSVNNNHLNQLFGGVPKGIENSVARKSGGEPLAPPSKQKTLEGAPPAEAATSPKTEGVPAGQGLILKGKSEPAVTESEPAPAKTATPKPAK